MLLEEQVPFLKQLARALAVQFGEQCEVAVHDLTQDLDHTIIAIENGHVSGRKVGDGASPIVLRALKDRDGAKDRYGYLTRTQDGRLLKSTSIYLRGEEDRAIALLSINFDITEITRANTILTQFITTDEAKKNVGEADAIFSNVNDLLERLIEESVDHVGKPVALMNKDDKIKAIRYLDGKGAFLIKKSGDKVTKFYDISKYTLYNYLDAASDEE